MASLSNPVNIKKLLAAQQVAINANVDSKTTAVSANVDAKTVETKAHVTTKNTDAKNAVVALVSAENDATQASVASVADSALTNQQLIDTVNANTNAKLAALSLSPVKTIQRGINSPVDDGNVTISAVDVSKSICNLTSSGGERNYGLRMKLVDSTTVFIESRTNSAANNGYCYWEIIEYV
jgi:hypothetical protein